VYEESHETPAEQAGEGAGGPAATGADTTETGAPPADAAEASAPPRRRARRTAAADSGGAAQTPTADGGPDAGRARGRRGTIAGETHAAVDRLTAAEGITRAEAFGRIATESGRRPGTVAAAYYRAARASGTGRPRRRRAATGAGDGAERAVSALRQALGELGELVRRQEQELERLRADAERYAEVQALLEAGAAGRTGRRRRGAG
jgi:hypothetical protein